MKCSPSFVGNWGKQSNYTTCWRQLHSQLLYWVFQQEKCLSYPPDCMGGVTETQIVWAVEGMHSSNPTQRGDTLFVLYLGESEAKSHQLFSPFFINDTNYEHLECFVILGTHSHVHRGQMSQI